MSKKDNLQQGYSARHNLTEAIAEELGGTGSALYKETIEHEVIIKGQNNLWRFK